jgi:hypothetical protein
LSAACDEQEVGCALQESGACRIDLLKPLEFHGKLLIHHHGRRVPSRVRRESIMKQVKAAQILDVEVMKEAVPQF